MKNEELIELMRRCEILSQELKAIIAEQEKRYINPVINKKLKGEQYVSRI